MDNRHPAFPNPTIREALCEIHFRLSDDEPWKPSVFGEFFKHIQSEFPSFEPIAHTPFKFRLGPSGIEQHFAPPQERMRYRHKTDRLLLQLSESILTINELPLYPGWAQMRADVLAAWENACEVIRPVCATRIGLRYINLIPRGHPTEAVGEWLKANDYLPRSVLSSLPGFAYRLQARLDDENRLVVTLGETLSDTDEIQSAIILDIDCITESEMDTSIAILGNCIDRLHDRVWDVFSVSTTPRLESLLKGGIA